MRFEFLQLVAWLRNGMSATEVIERIKGQHQEAARSLNIVRQQLAGREREKKATVLTLREIEALPRGPNGVTCYKGVGRMSVQQFRTDSLLIGRIRFMQESRNAIENGLKSKDKEVADDLSALEKKAKVSSPFD